MSMPRISEKAFQQMVIEAATYLGWAHFHPHDMRRSDSGWPDLVLVKPPRIVFAELKAENGRVSQAQRIWLDVLAEVEGAIAETWRPCDWDHVLEVLQQA